LAIRKEINHGKDIRKNQGGDTEAEEKEERTQPPSRHHRQFPSVTEREGGPRRKDSCDRDGQTGLLQTVMSVSEDPDQRKHPVAFGNQGVG